MLNNVIASSALSVPARVTDGTPLVYPPFINESKFCCFHALTKIEDFFNKMNKIVKIAGVRKTKSSIFFLYFKTIKTNKPKYNVIKSNLINTDKTENSPEINNNKVCRPALKCN